MLRWKYSRPLLFAITLAAVILPFAGNNPLAQAGLQQTLAVAFLYGALALTYDLLFGFTGLLSFGHAIYFASGVYVTAILVNDFKVNLFLSALIAIIFTAILAALTGAASLRTTGVSFAMVTLAFGQAGHIAISRDFGGYTNGEDGLPVNADALPDFFIGVVNTKYLYLLALGILLFIYLAAWWITESSAGRVFAAIRDNEQRVSVLGLNPNRFKLLSFILSAAMAALIGAAMLIVSGTATPRYASADTTIALLLMVILGGSVTRWGAVLGGILYSVLGTQLNVISQNSTFDSLPSIIRGPLVEPAFTLGLIFILIVMFAPGGISGAYYRARLKYLDKGKS
jgi:branched-chain amino acid transport system permease protein